MSFVRDQWYVAAYGRGRAGRCSPGRSGRAAGAVPDQRRAAGRAGGPLRAPALPAVGEPARRRHDRLRVPRVHLRPGRPRASRSPGRSASRGPRGSPPTRWPSRTPRLGLDRRPGAGRRRGDPAGARGWPTRGTPRSAAWSRWRPGTSCWWTTCWTCRTRPTCTAGTSAPPRSRRPRSPPRSTRSRGIVRVSRRMDDAACPPFYARSTGITGRIARWQDIEYHPPCLYLLHSRVAPAGVLPRPTAPTRDAFHVEIVYAITPSTETSTYDFWAVARDFALGRRGGLRVPARQQPDRGHAGRGGAEHAGAGDRRRARRLPGAQHQHRHRRPGRPAHAGPAGRGVRRPGRPGADDRGATGSTGCPAPTGCAAPATAGPTARAEDPVGMWQWLLAHPRPIPAPGRDPVPGNVVTGPEPELEPGRRAPGRRGRRRRHARPARPGRRRRCPPGRPARTST